MATEKRLAYIDGWVSYQDTISPYRSMYNWRLILCARDRILIIHFYQIVLQNFGKTKKRRHFVD